MDIVEHCSTNTPELPPSIMEHFSNTAKGYNPMAEDFSIVNAMQNHVEQTDMIAAKMSPIIARALVLAIFSIVTGSFYYNFFY